MTIHWKIFEKHFLSDGTIIVVFRFKHFGGKMHFLKFSQKTSAFNPFSAGLFLSHIAEPNFPK
jgi:hypothetical protein